MGVQFAFFFTDIFNKKAQKGWYSVATHWFLKTQSYTLCIFTEVLVNLDPIVNIHIVTNTEKKIPAYSYFLTYYWGEKNVSLFGKEL